MALKIKTGSVDLDQYNSDDILQIYNGLDCCITSEILPILQEQLTPTTAHTYRFERQLLAPALEMTMRGIKIDTVARSELLTKLLTDSKEITRRFQMFTYALCNLTINPNSHVQLKRLFYEVLKMPPQYSYKKGNKKLTVGRDALEKLAGMNELAAFFVRGILAAKAASKIAGTLKSAISKDGRLRAEFKVTGTVTGRWSSSKNAFNEGDNQQNQTKRVKFIYISDAGKKMTYIDLEQAESRAVGALVLGVTDDARYLDACETGDLHTEVCKMVWPELPWTDDEIHNKKVVAGQRFYRHFTYRDMAKRAGHMTNYGGTPHIMAISLKIERKIAEEFQEKYFSLFPIRDWHAEVAFTLQTTGELTTPFNRRRQFHDRLYEGTTLKAAIAHVPQSMVADYLNAGLRRVWRNLGDRFELFLQVHDAIGGQYAQEIENEILPQVVELVEQPFYVKGRKVVIPTEVQVGWNWGKATPDNPDGLTVWTGHDDRTRQIDQTLSVFHRKFS